LFYFKSFKSFIIVFIQFFSVAGIIISGRKYPGEILYLAFFILFIILGLIAIILMRNHLNIAPDIKPGTVLLNKGPYRFIRHPMYTSLLGCCICYLFDEFNIMRIVLYLILLLDILIKINYEEKILIKEFDNYADYKSKTKKLIPFIF